MQYLHANPSHKESIKNIAYKLNPEIWESYSDKTKLDKQSIESQRVDTLNLATRKYYGQS